MAENLIEEIYLGEIYRQPAKQSAQLKVVLPGVLSGQAGLRQQTPLPKPIWNRRISDAEAIADYFWYSQEFTLPSKP